MVHSMMSQTTIPKSFWDYALESVTCILNMVSTKKVEKTPYEVWHGQALKLSYLKVWGCEALVKRDTLTKPDKLEPRSIKCIIVGYPKKTIGYSFYYPPENEVFVARNAKFFVNSLINQEISRSLEDLEIIQEEDTHPSLDTSLNQKEDDQEIDEPQCNVNPICNSFRTCCAPYRMCLHVDTKEHELKDLGEPANYKDALKTIGHKWLFKKKTDMDGVFRAIRILIAIAAFYDYEIWQMDVKTAFLNEYLNEENPGELHLTTVKNILKYLRNTKDMFLVYGGDIKLEIRVSCHTDAGHLTDTNDLKSQTRYVFVVNGGDVDWKSTKKSIFETSSIDVEYITAFDASKKAVWIQKFIYGLGVVPTIEEPIGMYCDNTGAIAIAKDHEITKGARHFCASRNDCDNNEGFSIS
ncbi:hypothetical protein Tco_1139086 [Tanacetum coccineum]